MSQSAPVQAGPASDLKEVREKFFRLLAAERGSPEFVRLFHEVDTLLGRMSRDQQDPVPGWRAP